MEIDRHFHHLDEGGQKLFIAGLVSKSDIHTRGRLTRRKILITVKRERNDIVTFRTQGCRAVTMMYITVNDQNFINTRQRECEVRGYRQIIEQTETATKIGVSMVITTTEMNCHP
ncbi:Uncharacterised protein [Vibrio cholerae]|nr:Uncharacterised protein [Vibrio cholerae]